MLGASQIPDLSKDYTFRVGMPLNGQWGPGGNMGVGTNGNTSGSGGGSNLATHLPYIHKSSSVEQEPVEIIGPSLAVNIWHRVE